MSRLFADDIVALLRQRVETGQWPANSRIPPERDLAKEFGVARNTIRRAMSQLEAEGTLSRQIGRGTFVAAANSNALAAIIKRMEGISPADMMEIRQLLEPAAAAFAATNASVSELNAVQEACNNADAATDMPDFEHWDAEFHHRLFICARNEFLREIHNIMRILRNQPLWLAMKKRSFSEERRQTYCVEHQAILDALLRRDPEQARRAMLVHLQTVERNLLGRGEPSQV